MLKSIEKLRSIRASTRTKASTPGARILSSMLPARGMGWPGGWGADRLEQVMHFRNWNYVSIHTICSKIGQLTPNIAYLHHAKIPGKTTKYAETIRDFGGTNFASVNGIVTPTTGFMYRKALGVVKPHEDLEPVEFDHPLRRLIENPNQMDTSYDLFYELQLFMELCGVAYLWMVPNGWGVPCELWVIPSHWVWPRTNGGGVWDPSKIKGDLIDYYEVRPWGGTGSAGMLKFPAKEVMMFAMKSPINKLDGWSPQTAGAMWIDTEESIVKSRWAQMCNQARADVHIEVPGDMVDPDDERISRIEAKFMAKYQGELNYGKPIFTPAGTKVTPLSFSPQEMAYFQSEEQARDMVLALRQFPKTAAGISNDMTFGAVLATAASLCSNSINPRLMPLGLRLTKDLAPRFTNESNPIRVWWDDTSPADPQQVNSDIATDLQCILPGQEIQGRIIGGSKAWYSGKAVKIRTASGATLSVTRNHPVLTVMGFIDACQLKKGQNLLGYVNKSEFGTLLTERTSSRFLPSSFLVGEPLLDPLSFGHLDEQYAPTLVEEVFETLLSTWPSLGKKVSTVGIEFHGDAKGFKGQIHVVGSYCELWDRIVPNVPKRLSESDFVRLSGEKAFLSAPSHLHQVFGSELLPQHGFTNSSDPSSFAFGSSFLPSRLFDIRQDGADFGVTHSDFGGFGGTPNLDTSLLKLSPQPHVTNTQIGGDFVDGFPGCVAVCQDSHIGYGFGQEFLSFGPAANLDVSGKQALFDNPRSGTELARELIDMFPGEVLPDEIIDIEFFHYDGPVYDFESPLGYIIVESLLVSNCNAITPNEVRALRGRPAYKNGGNDPMISGPGGMVPLPLNTGEDLTEIGELVPAYPKDDAGDEGGGVGGDDYPEGDDGGSDYGGMGEAPKPKLSAPRIESPNNGGSLSVSNLSKGYKMTHDEWIENLPYTKVQKTREFSSTQLDLNGFPKIVKVLQGMQSRIDPEDLVGDGLETDFHVTVKYGLRTDNIEEVKALLRGTGPLTISLGKVSLFNKPEEDVVKVEVTGEDLHRLNALLSQLPHKDTYPVYSPHVTLAYVAPGTGERYISPPGKGDGAWGKITIRALTFSDKDGFKTRIPLEGGAVTKRVKSWDSMEDGGVTKPEEPQPGDVVDKGRYDDNPYDVRAFEMDGWFANVVRRRDGAVLHTTEESGSKLGAEDNARDWLRVGDRYERLKGVGKGEDEEKGILGDTVQSAGRWLASKWESLESRYGRKAALAMAIAGLVTLPIPGNITAIVGIAEGIRGVHGYFQREFPQVEEKGRKDWITLEGGTHVYTNERGEITAGPERLQGKPVNNLPDFPPKPSREKPDQGGSTANLSKPDSKTLRTLEDSSKQTWAKMNGAQRGALSDYSTDISVDLNRELRGGEPEDRDMRAIVKGLDSMFASIPKLKTPIDTYRGVSFKSDKDKDTFLKNLESGGEVELPGYTSTSVDPDVSKKFAEGKESGVLFKIKSNHGLYMEGLTGATVSKGEHEFLLPRGQKFKIGSKSETTSGGKTLTVYELEQL